MAKDKITLVQLRKQIAAQTGFDENLVGTFLKQYFDVVAEGLKLDTQVRIKDFGSFRVQAVEPRRSVDVRTGESIQLAGYNKVVFAASTILKEHVEADEVISITQPQPAGNAVGAVADNDPIKKLGQQAEEIKDILAELGITTEEPEEPEIPEESDIPDSPEMPDTLKEPVAPDIPEIPDTPEPPIIYDSTPAPQKHKKKRPWLTLGMIMLVMCVLLIIAYFALEFFAADWINNKLAEYRTEQVITETGESEEDIVTVDETNQTDEANQEQTASDDTQIETQTDTQTGNQTQSQPTAITIGNSQFEILRTEVLTDGSRLSWLSRKYYGEPDFWVYIYLANENNIADPNDIPIGTKILIPKLPLEMINTNDEAVLMRARELQDKILNK